MPFKFGELEVFTITEISQTTGITLPTLRGYINSGEMKARKIGKIGWCVTQEAIKEFFETGNQGDNENNNQTSVS